MHASGSKDKGLSRAAVDAEKGLEIMLDAQLNLIPGQHAVAKKSSAIIGCLPRKRSSLWGGCAILIFGTGVTGNGILYLLLESTIQQRRMINWREFKKEPPEQLKDLKYTV